MSNMVERERGRDRERQEGRGTLLSSDVSLAFAYDSTRSESVSGWGRDEQGIHFGSRWLTLLLLPLLPATLHVQACMQADCRRVKERVRAETLQWITGNNTWREEEREYKLKGNLTIHSRACLQQH